MYSVLYVFMCVGKDSPGSESDGGDSRSETGSTEIQPKKVISHLQYRFLLIDALILGNLRLPSTFPCNETKKFCTLACNLSTNV